MELCGAKTIKERVLTFGGTAAAGGQEGVRFSRSWQDATRTAEEIYQIFYVYGGEVHL